jgi:hypothetical protein
MKLKPPISGINQQRSTKQNNSATYIRTLMGHRRIQIQKHQPKRQ